MSPIEHGNYIRLGESVCIEGYAIHTVILPISVTQPAQLLSSDKEVGILRYESGRNHGYSTNKSTPFIK